MKKTITLIFTLLIFTVSFCFDSFAEYKEEITFQGIPFGSSYTKVLEKCKELGLEIEEPHLEGNSATFSIRTDTSVAGHDGFSLYLDFVLVPENNELVFEADKGILYKASYGYIQRSDKPLNKVPNEAGNIRNDIAKKLEALYGKSDEKSGITSKYTYSWEDLFYKVYGKNGTSVEITDRLCDSYDNGGVHYFEFHIIYRYDCENLINQGKEIIERYKNQKILAEENMTGL